MSRIAKYLLHHSYQTNWTTLLYHPFYLRRRLLYRSILKNAPLIQGKILDYGCGRKPYRNLFPQVKEYTGADIHNSGYPSSQSSADIFFEDALPFKDKHFDAVLCFEVLEHIFTPEESLKDIHRVLKPGGKLMLSVPFFCNEHEIPYDYGRYTYYGLKHLLNKHGFSLLTSQKVGTFWETLLHLHCTYIHNILYKLTSSHYLSYALAAPITCIHNLLGRGLGACLPKDKSFYLNHFVVAEKSSFSPSSAPK